MLIAVANPVLYLAGWEVSGQEPNLGGALALCVVLLAAAFGMWRMRYWAVLGFEVLLGITLVFAGLSLLVPSNLQAVALAVGVMARRRPAVLEADPRDGAHPAPRPREARGTVTSPEGGACDDCRAKPTLY